MLNERTHSLDLLVGVIVLQILATLNKLTRHPPFQGFLALDAGIGFSRAILVILLLHLLFLLFYVDQLEVSVDVITEA